MASIAGAAAAAASQAGVAVDATTLASAVNQAAGTNISAAQVESAAVAAEFNSLVIDFVLVVLVVEENPAQDASPS